MYTVLKIWIKSWRSIYQMTHGMGTLIIYISSPNQRIHFYLGSFCSSSHLLISVKYSKSQLVKLKRYCHPKQRIISKWTRIGAHHSSDYYKRAIIHSYRVTSVKMCTSTSVMESTYPSTSGHLTCTHKTVMQLLQFLKFHPVDGIAISTIRRITRKCDLLRGFVAERTRFNSSLFLKIWTSSCELEVSSAPTRWTH